MGKFIEKEISLARKINSEEDLNACIFDLAGKYSMNASVLKDLVISNSAISIPDVVSVFKDNSGEITVRIGEAKAGGQLDVKNLPKNLETLMGNRLFEKEGQKIERAILITATSDRGEGLRAARFPHKGNWVNQISKNGYASEIKVLCNEEAAEWASGRSMSPEAYAGFITKLAEKSGVAMFDLLLR